jgi:hypothetical protein
MKASKINEISAIIENIIENIENEKTSKPAMAKARNQQWHGGMACGGNIIMA